MCILNWNFFCHYSWNSLHWHPSILQSRKCTRRNKPMVLFYMSAFTSHFSIINLSTFMMMPIDSSFFLTLSLPVCFANSSSVGLIKLVLMLISIYSPPSFTCSFARTLLRTSLKLSPANPNLFNFS
jgi:hypothetical protein